MIGANCEARAAVRVLVFAALVVSTGVPVFAQVYTIQPRSMQVDNKPRGDFSLSLRYVGKIGVSFSGVGNIDMSEAFNIGDTTSEMTRIYHDGAVGLDTQTTGDGTDVPDNGRTNSWEYGYESQVTEYGDIAFHRYRMVNDGTVVDAESSGIPGFDMQYDMCVGVFGPKVSESVWRFSWGATAGATMASVNASTRGTITADLLTTTDIYSLDGQPVPSAPYTAPSTDTINGVSVASTVLLLNRPYSREEVLEPGGAQIDGFWQVKGAYYAMRIGPWLRWHPGRRISLRASAGVTYAYAGLHMEYDELLANREILGTAREGDSTPVEKLESYGLFGALDAEFWLTEKTGFFASFTYERLSREIDLTTGGRTATVDLTSGAGFRIGVTTKF